MSFKLKSEDITKINNALGAKAKEFEGAYTWSIKNQDNSKPMVFTIFDNVDLGGSKGAMVSVQTRHGYYELHDLNSIIYFEPDEVILIKSDDEYISCLIIGGGCTCSLYSNIKRNLLKADFADLHPAVLLSAMQLSITENII